MTGVNISAPEFAYLLATVGVKNILGLKAPELFPESEKEQEEIYSVGFEQLVEKDWIEEKEGTYDFDPALLEMTAIVGAPEQFLAIINHNGGEKSLLLHYLFDDRIVQLAATDEDEFSLGFVPELDQTTEHISEITGVTQAATGEEFSIPMELFGQMQRAKKSFSKKVVDNLAEEGASSEAIGQLEIAFTSGQRSEIVLASLEAGEVAHGRRAWIYGADENGWLFYLDSAQAKQVSVVNCDRSQVEDWIQSSLAELE